MQTERPLLSLDRSRRFELLASLSEPDGEQLADAALRAAGRTAGDVTVLAPATVGMLMARATDGARGECFNLAEVLVTEARVSLDGHDGWGLVMGRRPAFAMAVAVADAASEASVDACSLVERELAEHDMTTRGELAREWTALEPTQVDFEIAR